MVRHGGGCGDGGWRWLSTVGRFVALRWLCWAVTATDAGLDADDRLSVPSVEFGIVAEHIISRLRQRAGCVVFNELAGCESSSCADSGELRVQGVWVGDCAAVA